MASWSDWDYGSGRPAGREKKEANIRNRIRNFLATLRQTWALAGEKHIGLIAAGVAFFGLFGIFPGIAAVIAIYGLAADPLVIGEQLLLMEDVIPPDAFALLVTQTNRLLAAPSQTLGWATLVSIMLALWSCRAGVGALIDGLNAIAGHQARSGIWSLIVAFAMTVTLVSLAVVAVSSVVIAPIILAFLPLTAVTGWLLEGLRWIVALSALIAALSILYRFGPSRIGGRGRWLTVGAFVVVVLWILSSVGLSYYLSNFASYNEVYGSLGAVIGMMLWLYVSAYLILLGAALNAIVHGCHALPDQVTALRV